MSNINLIIQEAKRILRNIDLSDTLRNFSSKQFCPASKSDELKKIMLDIEIHLSEMGLYGGYFIILHHMLQLKRIKTYTKSSVSKIFFKNLYSTIQLKVILSKILIFLF